MSGIGSPKNLVDALLHGTYKPYITEAQVRKHKAWNSIDDNTNEKGEIEFEMDPHNQEFDESIEPLSEMRQDLGTGEIIATNFGIVEKKKVEEKLKKICNDICNAMDIRINKSELQKQSIFLFGKNPICMQSVVAADIGRLINHIPGPNAEY